jgi:hypothetical protein
LPTSDCDSPLLRSFGRQAGLEREGRPSKPAGRRLAVGFQQFFRENEGRRRPSMAADVDAKDVDAKEVPAAGLIVTPLL